MEQLASCEGSGELRRTHEVVGQRYARGSERVVAGGRLANRVFGKLKRKGKTRLINVGIVPKIKGNKLNSLLRSGEAYVRLPKH